MATPIEFMQFDATPYQRIPNINTRATLALARALRDRTPAELSDGVAKEAARLDAVIAEAEAVFTARRRDEDAPEYGAAVTFDAAADRLWSALHGQLWSWSAFEHPGFDAAISAEGELGGLIAAARAKADSAHDLLARLFGEQGLQPLRAPFHEQSEETAAMIRLIEEDQLRDDLDELVGPELVAAVIAVQPIYEQMARDRLTGSNDAAATIRELQRKLRFRIGRYSAQLLGMIDDDVPHSLEQVKAALRPLIGMREDLARRGRAVSQTRGSEGDAGGAGAIVGADGAEAAEGTEAEAGSNEV